jgi:hypothetical protein
LDQRHRETGKAIILVLDNGPCHTSKAGREELAARADWLQVIWPACYSPELSKKEREWRYRKRDARGHLARDLRSFAALSWMARGGSAVAAWTALTTCPTGSSPATARRPLDANRDGQKAPRTRTSAATIARIYLHLLSPNYSRWGKAVVRSGRRAWLG